MLRDVFFKGKPVEALAALSRSDRVWYPSILGKEIDCTYPHVVNTIKVFENEGLIVTEERGRIRVIRLTDEGLEIAKSFDRILRKMKKIERKKKKQKNLGKT